MFAETDCAASVNCDLSLKSDTAAASRKAHFKQVHPPLPHFQSHVATIEIISFRVFHKLTPHPFIHRSTHPTIPSSDDPLIQSSPHPFIQSSTHRSSVMVRSVLIGIFSVSTCFLPDGQITSMRPICVASSNPK